MAKPYRHLRMYPNTLNCAEVGEKHKIKPCKTCRLYVHKAKRGKNKKVGDGERAEGSGKASKYKVLIIVV